MASMDLNGRITVLGAMLASLTLAGCMSSPTYGTNKTSGSQLLDDVSNIASFGPKKKDPIAYNPRPDLVRPVAGKPGQLPSPQENAVAANKANWPESPEQRRSRLRDEATANQNNPNYVPQVENDAPPSTRTVDNGEHGVYNDRNPPPSGVNTASKQSAEFRARRLASTAGSATTRRYLSEPPLAYRAPAPTASADELGEDEAKKERDRKAAARKDKGFSFKNLIPWN